MNKLFLILGLMIIAAPAFASRARLEALGEGKNGSYYIQDNRDIFLNPAHISKYKKKLYLELGGASGTAATGAGATDGSGTSGTAQGGFTNTFGDYTYGLWMNNNNDFWQAAATGSGGNGFAAPESQLDFFLGGEGSMAWGLNLFYAGNAAKVAGISSSASTFGVGFGIDMNNFQVWANVDILGKSTIDNGATNGNELKEKVSFDAGLSYAQENWTWFGKFMNFGTDTNTVVTTERRYSMYGIGGGYKHEMSKATTMFARIEADMDKDDTNGVATQSYDIPVVVAAESQALSWLAIRGSIAYSLFGQQWTETTRNSFGGSTTVAAGVGMTFGDVQIDGLVASSAANNGGAATGFGTGNRANQTFGFGDNMISRIGLTYNF
ncbi:MAG: hypothetical protein JST80_09650 [Bdellovibrionales bacterium]|nr:hypothetical protein [Bdellovibrionales bacterium]